MVAFCRHVMTFREIISTGIDTFTWPYNPGSVSEATFNLLAYTVYVVRPDADISDGGWTTESGGSNLFASVDEVTQNDSDYIQSALTPSNDECELSLQNFGGEEPVDQLKVTYRYKKDGTASVNLIVTLVEGSTVIATWTETDIPAVLTTTTHQLSAIEFASITDFSNLRLRLKANA